MVEIRLLDEGWVEDTINALLAAGEGITDLERDVCREEGYKEAGQVIARIEEAAAGTPMAGVLYEYGNAIESKSGYEYTAAYLNGIKKGFQLAMFLNPAERAKGPEPSGASGQPGPP